MAGAASLEPTFPVLETGVLTSVRSAHVKSMRLIDMTHASFKEVRNMAYLTQFLHLYNNTSID